MREAVRSRRRLLQMVGLALTGTLAGCQGASDEPTATESDAPATTAQFSTETDVPVTAEATEPVAETAIPAGKLVPADGDPHDNFGSAVALTEDRALVAAMRDEDPNGTWAGSAYVVGLSS